jgi:hypothetical protein
MRAQVRNELLAEAGKLGAVHTVHPGVLSLYLTFPPDPAGLRCLRTRADDRIAAAESAVGGCGHVAEEDRSCVRESLELNGNGWLGRTVAIFACAEVRLLEAFPLPCRLPDRAVLGVRPHIRPLLAAAQRCPAYRVAVLDRRHAWLFHVASGDRETATAPVAGTVSSHSETAAKLAKVMADGEPEPLVIGGDMVAIRQLFASLPPRVRERFAGCFTADVHTLTAARVRELAAPLVARWAAQRVAHLAGQVAAMAPAGLAASGLRACLAAVNAGAGQTLIVPDEGLVPGFECGRCGALSVDADTCPDWGTAALPVPDVIEEMVARTLEDGGQVWPVHDAGSQMAARLRSPSDLEAEFASRAA